MVWGTIRRSVASSWAAGNSVSRINPAWIRQTCFAPREAMINTNGFERLQTFSYSALGGRVGAAVPSMTENESVDVVEVNGFVAQSKTEKGSAAPVARSMNAINLIGMEKVVNTLARKVNDGSANFDKMAGASFTKLNSGVCGCHSGTPIFNLHQSAILGLHSDKIGLSLGKKGLTVHHFSTDNPTDAPNSLLRPLSPHLPVYKPQSSSMVSIFNRFAAAFLTAEILLVYLLLQIGSTSLTYYSFYQLFFHSSKLTLLATEITALAMAYHVIYGVRALIRLFRW